MTEKNDFTTRSSEGVLSSSLHQVPTFATASTRASFRSQFTFVEDAELVSSESTVVGDNNISESINSDTGSITMDRSTRNAQSAIAIHQYYPDGRLVNTEDVCEMSYREHVRHQRRQLSTRIQGRVISFTNPGDGNNAHFHENPFFMKRYAQDAEVERSAVIFCRKADNRALEQARVARARAENMTAGENNLLSRSKAPIVFLSTAAAEERLRPGDPPLPILRPHEFCNLVIEYGIELPNPYKEEEEGFDGKTEVPNHGPSSQEEIEKMSTEELERYVLSQYREQVVKKVIASGKVTLSQVEKMSMEQLEAEYKKIEEAEQEERKNAPDPDNDLDFWDFMKRRGKWEER